MKKLCLLLVAILPGCASLERLRPDIEAKALPSRLDEIAYVNQLRQAYTLKKPDGMADNQCFDGTGLRRFNPTLSEGYSIHDDETEQLAGSPITSAETKGTAGKCVFFASSNDSAAIKTYLEAGFGLTDIYCQRFFIVANQSAAKRRFQRDSGTTVGTLVSSVLTAANAGQTAGGIVAAGFGALDSTYKNIDSAFMVAPDLAAVRKLVFAAQNDFRSKVLSSTTSEADIPTSYAGARSVIERYAGLCSYTGMKQLVGLSVDSQAAELDAKAEKNKFPADGAGAGKPAAGGAVPAASLAAPAASESVPTTAN